MRNKKTQTDEFWNRRAAQAESRAEVNISDTVQRDHELEFVLEQLAPTDRVLEVGCGNGYVTNILRERVAHVDAFDFAENMIAAARDGYGERNNRFFHDSALSMDHAGEDYDAAVCIRVLINLADLDEQKIAIRNIAGRLRPGGRLILVEGFRDGFEALSKVRTAAGLSPLRPAPINFYSSLAELMPEILEHFAVANTWHSGLFDLLTRVVHPLVNGEDAAQGPGSFHASIAPLLSAFDGIDLAGYARLHGFCLIRK